MKNIRNFCIIAHIDHGKSTLADRLLEFTRTVTDREMQEQLLDSMDLERERGITIKSHAIQMNYAKDDTEYTLNLIDTPGHVDFSYEVSRSIAACEGALLVVDASQGIEAQTISNLYLAIDHDLEVIPVLNKIDLPGAMPDEVSDQIIDLIGCKKEDILHASAKEGIGIEDILNAIVARVPAPEGNTDEALQAMIFDSVFNPYRGIEVFFRVFNGEIRKGEKVKFVNTGKTYEADEIGVLKLQHEPKNIISAGNVGYLISGIKVAKEVKVGDTITHVDNPTTRPVRGFEDVKPMVYAGIYPVETSDFEELRASMEKLQLNDASLVWEPETSAALGFGFRCGFLGMLHMEIIQERLEREFDMTVITTVPSVRFHAITTDDEIQTVSAPSEMPEGNLISHVEEPFIRAQIITKSEFIGPVIALCMDKRGEIKNQVYLTSDRVELTFELPLAEIVFDFFDKLKTISRGYASLDYELIGYRKSHLVKLDIMLNGDKVDALSAIVHRDKAYEWGKRLCEKLRELLPRQMFEIAIQAAIGTKVIARETVKAMRKNVLAKCYGGDISRKRKLLDKQKKGKKRMRQVGNVEIPQEAFMAVLKLDLENMPQLLDGRKVATEIKNEIAEKVTAFKAGGKRAPHLAIILVGDDGASHTYVNGKISACKAVGFDYTLMQFANTISEDKLEKHIDLLNEDEDIDGFIVQLPLPEHISVEHITGHISPTKDVDGFTNQNFGSIVSHNPLLLPATPFGVMELLSRHKIETKGKHCVVVGASRIAGAPLSLMMMEQGLATVTLCHKYTEDLKSHTSKADILVVAVGKPGLITADMVKQDAVVVDVGTTRVEDNSKKSGFRLSGDVDYDAVSSKVSYITPVPGGVGPMTIASLLLNTLKTYEMNMDSTQTLSNSID